MRHLIFTLAFALALVSTAPAQVPGMGHVFIVVEENANYSSVIGNTSMPYLNSLASQYGVATQYYADTHPSIGNYFMMTTGQILTNDDSMTPSNFPVSADNIVRHLMSAGKTWKSYAEDLPSIGYTGGDTGNYLVRHNPFAYFTDVQNSTSEKMNLVPFTQFATDLASNALPQYSFIVPNKCNDAHDCSLSTADNWLKNNIARLISSTTFQQDGMLIILFDEAGSDNTNGGGRIAWVVVSPKAKQSYQSTTLYKHASTLRLTMEALGMTYNLAAAGTAPAMGEFFVTATPTTTPTAVLTVSPNSGTAPLAITADSSGSTDSGGTIASRAFNFGDGSPVVNTTSLTALHTYNSAGTYTVTLTITDSSGKTATATQAVSVTAPPTTPTLSPTAVLTVSPQTGLVPLTVNADSSQSYETGGSIASRSFNFGDGTPAVTGVSVSHNYTTGGKYTITLTVTDGAGTSATATQSVLVKRHGKVH